MFLTATIDVLIDECGEARIEQTVPVDAESRAVSDDRHRTGHQRGHPTECVVQIGDGRVGQGDAAEATEFDGFVAGEGEVVGGHERTVDTARGDVEYRGSAAVQAHDHIDGGTHIE